MVPPRTAPWVPPLNASVIAVVLSVRLPLASSSSTWTAGATGTPAPTFAGCVRKAIDAVGPGTAVAVNDAEGPPAMLALAVTGPLFAPSVRVFDDVPSAPVAVLAAIVPPVADHAT